jgi:hypothetical protein
LKEKAITVFDNFDFKILKDIVESIPLKLKNCKFSEFSSNNSFNNCE